MDIIKEFVKLALNHEDGSPFSITHYAEDKTAEGGVRRNGTELYHQSRIGNARFIYGIRLYGEERLPSVSEKTELIAVVSAGTVYILEDSRLFDHSYVKDKKYPEHSQDFYAESRRLQAALRDTYFPKFYETLPPADSIPIRENDWRNAARERILFRTGEAVKQEFDPDLHEKDVLSLLCGFESEEAIAKRLFQRYRGAYAFRKATELKIKEMMRRSDIVKPYEQQIADGIANQDAKTVMVRFERGDFGASEKLTLLILRNRLITGEGINYYLFETKIGGERLYKALNIGKNDANLTCADITKITYGKNTLYERTEKED